MAGIKRQVELPTRELRERYARISKADWAEIAYDMFMEWGMGESNAATYEDFMSEIERRKEIVKRNRSII